MLDPENHVRREAEHFKLTPLEMAVFRYQYGHYTGIQESLAFGAVRSPVESEPDFKGEDLDRLLACYARLMLDGMWLSPRPMTLYRGNPLFRGTPSGYDYGFISLTRDEDYASKYPEYVTVEVPAGVPIIDVDFMPNVRALTIAMQMCEVILHPDYQYLLPPHFRA